MQYIIRRAQRQRQKFKMFEHNTQHSRKKKIDIAIYLIKYCFEDSYDYPTINHIYCISTS